MRMTRTANHEVVWTEPATITVGDAELPLQQSRLAASIGYPLALRIGANNDFNSSNDQQTMTITVVDPTPSPPAPPPPSGGTGGGGGGGGSMSWLLAALLLAMWHHRRARSRAHR